MSLSQEELRDREADVLREQGKLFLPLSAQLTDPDQSPPISFGLPGLDQLLGGGLRRGLHLVVGYQHSGKTQLLLRLIWENRDKPIVLFTPDEDVDRVSNKALAITTGKSLQELMEAPRHYKQANLGLSFPKLAVCEDSLSADDMLQYIQEVEDYYGEPVALVAYDYLEHFANMRGGDSVAGVKNAAKKLKRLAKITRIPWFVIHQLNRGGANGKPVRPEMLAFGGEQDADTIIAVWQEIQQSEPTHKVINQHHHQPTVHLAIGKNKQTYQYFGGMTWHGQAHAFTPDGLIREMTSRDYVHTNTTPVWDRVQAGWGNGKGSND